MPHPQKIINFGFNYNKIYTFGYNLKNLLKKRRQKDFFLFERFKFKIKLNYKNYFLLNNYIFKNPLKLNKNLKYFKNLNKKFKQIIIIYYGKYTSFFEYFLDTKNYKRYIYNNSFNFLKINISNAKNINFRINKEDLLFKPIYIKKSSKKKLVLFLMIDGLSNTLVSLMPNTKKYFSNKNKLNNAWSNSEWTLPTFGNLISGKYASNHLVFRHDTSYATYFNKLTPNEQLKINVKKNMFESFQGMNFVTGCYSPYVRINPTYEYEKGVDIFKYCEKYSSNEIIDSIISQIEMFDQTSNFIFSHFFDSHGAMKDYIRLNEYSNFPDKNYFFETNNPKKANFLKDNYRKIETKSAFNRIDKSLAYLYHYLNKKKFDDYTIVLFGDHGTVFEEFVVTGNVLNNYHNNIALLLNDKKYNFKNKKNKFIETIDLFPSLLYRYSKNQYIKRNKDFDGKNSLYSKYKKERAISESIRSPDYQIQIKTKDLTSYSFYELKNYKIGKFSNTKYYDKNDKLLNPKKISVNKIKKMDKILDNHIKKCKLRSN